jgi:hypothetical protein
MDKRRFRDDNVTACGVYKETTKEDIKEALKRAKNDVKRFNRHLDVLADMSTTYEYPQSSLAAFVGYATISLSNAENNVERIKGELNG